jgi:membrane-associated protease RseP (regulator of RpoE activity)
LFLAVSKDGFAEEKAKEVQIISVSGDEAEADAAAEAEGAWGGGKGGYLGLSLREDTKHTEGGALVKHVVSDSPAAKAGVKDGDVIVGFSGSVVRGPAKVSEKLREAKPGDKVVVDVRRDSKVQKITIELGERPTMAWRIRSGDMAPLSEDQQMALEKSLERLDDQLPDLKKRVGNMRFYAPGRHGLMAFGRSKPLLGIEMVETTPELREALGGSKDAGVLVGKVLTGSAAEKSGLKVGDLITAVDGEKVSDAGELAEAIGKHEGKTVDLDVVRDKRTIHVKALLPRLDEPEDEPTGPRASAWRIPGMAPMPGLAPRPALPPVPPTPAFAPWTPPLPPAAPCAPAQVV